MLKMEACSVKNTKYDDKCNEDIVYCNQEQKYAILLDGVSRDRENGRYPNPSPALEVSKLFLNTIQKYVNENTLVVLNEHNIKNTMCFGNDAVHIYNQNNPDEFPAGTVGIIVMIYDTKMVYSYIGDCNGVIIHNNVCNFFTTKQTKQVFLHKRELTTNQIRTEICNNYVHPYGYGVLDGNKGAEKFIRSGVETISSGDTIILFSDGAEESLYKLAVEEWIDKPIRELIVDIDSKRKAPIIGLDDQSLIRIQV